RALPGTANSSLRRLGKTQTPRRRGEYYPRGSLTRARPTMVRSGLTTGPGVGASATKAPRQAGGNKTMTEAQAAAPQGHDAPASKMRQVVIASAAGTVFEWYDFFVYGALASVMSAHFFANL